MKIFGIEYDGRGWVLLILYKMKYYTIEEIQKMSKKKRKAIAKAIWNI